MIDKKQETSTDRAWKSLRGRLESEGLLPDPTPGPVLHRSRRNTRRYFLLTACAAAGVFGVLLIGWKFLGKNELLHLRNETGLPVLVSSLKDGSIVWLEENSTLSYPAAFTGAERRVRLEGNAFFEVAGDRERPFIVETDRATVEVIGTAFRVQAEKNGDFILSVSRGEVKVSGNLQEETSLHILPGETALFSGETLVKTGTTTPGDVPIRNEIYFKDQYLEDIIRYINGNPDSIQVILAPGTEQRRVTVGFSGEPVERMVELLCDGLGLNYSREGNRITISEMNR